ncbi:GTP cyclohydrolase I FolE [Jannaschia sp. R86511]|uniref:GTP cyclohydrolase I FolE n=1 Tax=Jannaschia sp. R86511 TaxID=3093853 RepID=UPI0036D363D3
MTTSVAGPMPEPDLDAATDAARAFLTALGMDLDAPGLDRTPRRMAKAYAEMFRPRPFELTTFPNDEGYDEMVVAHGIGFTSVCEHHLLPFSGHATVGYLPDDRIVGLSKLARVVELFARRPQVQERMTQQVARFLAEQLSPKGVGVVLSAEHSCMTVRGVQAHGSSTTTSALLGRMREDARTRAEFLALSGR